MSTTFNRFRNLSFTALFMAAFCLSLVGSLITPRQVDAMQLPTSYGAGISAQFNDFHNIVLINGQFQIIFTDTNPYDDYWIYSALTILDTSIVPNKPEPWPSGCAGMIQVGTKRVKPDLDSKWVVEQPGVSIAQQNGKPSWDAVLRIDIGNPPVTSCSRHSALDSYDKDNHAVNGTNLNVTDSVPYKTKMQYIYTSDTTIRSFDNNAGTFTKGTTSDPNIWLKDGDGGTDGKCIDRLVIDANNKLIGRRYEIDPDGNRYIRRDFANPGENILDQTCFVLRINGFEGWANGDFDIASGHWDATICALGAPCSNVINTSLDAAGVGASSGSDGIVQADCSYSINPLTWIFCPILDGIQAVISNWDTVIEEQLNIDTTWFERSPPDAENKKTGDYYYEAWNSFYNIAVSLLLIIGIVMVLSQALQFGPFDAYTIRRIMPRIIIAVVAMTLSWSLLGLLIDIFNTLGNGIRFIIYSPFKTLNNPTISGLTLTAGLVATIGAGTVGIMGLITFLGAAALALLVGLATIIFRQVLVVTLVIFSPVAILCFILPGTRKIWQLWYNTLIRALVVFPIIMAFIAMGSVFAKVLSVDNASNFQQIAALFALYAPFFMLPLAFTLAGGTVGAFKAAASNRAAPRMAKLKETRSQSRQATRANIRGNNAFHGGTATERNADGSIKTRGSLRGRANERLARGANVGAAGLSLNRQTRRGRINDRMSASSMQNTAGLMETREASAIMSNDTLLEAGRARGLNGAELADLPTTRATLRARYEAGGLTGVDLDNRVDAQLAAIRNSGTNATGQQGSEASIRQNLMLQGQTGRELDQNVAAVRNATRAKGQSAYNAMAAVKIAGTGTGYINGQGEMHAALNAAAGGDRVLYGQLLNQARGEAARAGRSDLSGNGYGEALAAGNAQFIAGDRAVDIALTTAVTDEQVLQGQGIATVMNGKNNQAARLMTNLTGRLKDAKNGVSYDNDGKRVQGAVREDEAIELASQLVAARAAMGSNTTALNRQATVEALESVGIDMSSNQSTTQQFANQFVSMDPSRAPQIPVPAIGPTTYTAGQTMHSSRKLPSGYMSNIASGGELTQEGEREQNENTQYTQLTQERARVFENEIRNRAGMFEQGEQQRTIAAQQQAQQQQAQPPQNGNGSGTTP